jgi:hypothetical protein
MRTEKCLKCGGDVDLKDKYGSRVKSAYCSSCGACHNYSFDAGLTGDMLVLYHLLEKEDCNVLGCQCGGECKESPQDDKEEDDIKEGDKFKVMRGKPQIDEWEYHRGDIYEVLNILNPVIRSKINGEIKQHLHDGLLVKVSPREYKEEEMNSYKCKSCDCVVDTFVDIEDEDNFLCPNCLEKARIKVFSLDAGVEKESPFERRDIRPEEQTDISGFPIKHDLESIKESQKEPYYEHKPAGYTNEHYKGDIETIEKVSMILGHLSTKIDTNQGYLLGNVIKYIDRMGKKDSAEKDSFKAADYLHRLIKGEWLNG